MQRKFSADQLRELDNSSSRILGARKTLTVRVLVTGLVIGDVQSGKTTNFVVFAIRHWMLVTKLWLFFLACITCASRPK